MTNAEMIRLRDLIRAWLDAFNSLERDLDLEKKGQFHGTLCGTPANNAAIALINALRSCWTCETDDGAHVEALVVVLEEIRARDKRGPWEANWEPIHGKI